MKLWKYMSTLIVLITCLASSSLTKADSLVSKSDVISWAQGLANKGVGVDYDGVYGMQCVDLPNWILGKYFGRPIWGNAINLLDSAQQAGYTVIRNTGANRPQAGDIFVMRTNYHIYGHTGLVIADSDGQSLRTIEQNVDGGSGTFTVGGPARYRTRPFYSSEGAIIGWIRPSYRDSGNLFASSPIVNSTSPTSTSSYKKIRDEHGRFTVTVDKLNVRNAPSTAGTPVATYTDGMSFYYDSVYVGDGYLWLSYVSTSGVRRYVAYGTEKNQQVVTAFGRMG